MKRIKLILKNITSWSGIIFLLNLTSFSKKLSDETVLKAHYKKRTGKKLNISNPKTFNEKLQWLKIHNRNPEYTRIVDKVTFKDYIREKLGDGYTVPTLGVWDKFDDIDFDKLPDKFVLKCNHDSGGLIICKDKSKLDIDHAREIIEKCLKRNYYWSSREWPYKDVKPCILAEEYLDLPEGMVEYKLFSFNGEAKVIDVCMGIAHTSSRTNTFYDREWNKLPIQTLLPNEKGDIEAPKELPQMLEIADKLSKGIPQVRVDFYIYKGQIYLGEMTFFHNSGTCPINPEEWDYKLGEYIDLSIVDNK
ncbi:MAG: glycosyl transferase [Ruminococcaceae bacterium]|nr:glycosyl transferase [Oscillospiraceae bacterium]